MDWWDRIKGKIFRGNLWFFSHVICRMMIGLTLSEIINTDPDIVERNEPDYLSDTSHQAEGIMLATVSLLGISLLLDALDFNNEKPVVNTIKWYMWDVIPDAVYANWMLNAMVSLGVQLYLGESLNEQTDSSFDQLRQFLTPCGFFIGSVASLLDARYRSSKERAAEIAKIQSKDHYLVVDLLHCSKEIVCLARPSPGMYILRGGMLGLTVTADLSGFIFMMYDPGNLSKQIASAVGLAAMIGSASAFYRFRDDVSAQNFITKPLAHTVYGAWVSVMSINLAHMAATGHPVPNNEAMKLAITALHTIRETVIACWRYKRPEQFRPDSSYEPQYSPMMAAPEGVGGPHGERAVQPRLGDIERVGYAPIGGGAGRASRVVRSSSMSGSLTGGSAALSTRTDDPRHALVLAESLNNDAGAEEGPAEGGFRCSIQ